jgi:DNA transposition AAA+ family ATPase
MKNEARGKDKGDGVTAPIGNVAQVLRALDRAMNAPPSLDKIVVHNGPSGAGKSFGASRAANQHRAYYLEIKPTWTVKALLQNLLKEMEIKPATTIADMADQGAEQLALSRRPLILDEFDHLVDRHSLGVEVVRSLHDAAGKAPILLIGEEHLEKKLRRWERFHNRVLDWFPTIAATIEDSQKLADLYSPDFEIQRDLLDALHRASRGVVRRICINIHRVREYAVSEDFKKIALEHWKGDFYTGEAPRRSL